MFGIGLLFVHPRARLHFVGDRGGGIVPSSTDVCRQKGIEFSFLDLLGQRG